MRPRPTTAPIASAALAVLCLAGLSGCIAMDAADCEAATGPRTPAAGEAYMHTAPGQAWDTVVLQDGGAAPADASMGAGWTVEAQRLSSAEGDNFSVLRVTPGEGPGRLDLAYSHPACKGTWGTLSWDLAAPRSGKSAEPGQGVHAFTAGFLEDGTLFYTNIGAVDQADWPRVEWYAWGGGDALPVYVYDEDRAEQPAQWKDPQAGTPAEGTVPGLGYFTTIPGFNEALKGLSTNTVRVVRMAPEDGYTRPGNEEHPLYGSALVFYIKLVDVVDLPCPASAPARLCQVPQPFPV